MTAEQIRDAKWMRRIKIATIAVSVYAIVASVATIAWEMVVR